MPASVTHAYFASDVYDTLPASIKNVLSVPRLRMFGQSTDSFIFYRLFSFKRAIIFVNFNVFFILLTLGSFLLL